MKVKVLLFAALKDQIGQTSVWVDLPDSATVTDVRQRMGDQFPQSKALLQRSAFAFENNFLIEHSPLEPESEIACIPPVSGG